MPLNKSEFSSYIRAFKFRELFNEMGWDNDKVSQPIVVDTETFVLNTVAKKSGFRIFVCDPGADGLVPDYNTRIKIDAKLRKLFQEHLIIFQDTNRTQQIWLFVARQSGKPTRVTETRWNKDQEPELLFQRASGVFFELDEEDNITIVDVTQRVAANFDQNNEKVTKRFYERFTKEHKAFSGFVTGIDDHIDQWNKANPKAPKENQNKQWYVSLMLNRLMFCYFIQKKGFLDKNNNYLPDKLQESRERKGKNKYYSFYRDFLLALFHEGLGTPEHSAALKTEIGRVPYLNGGLFDEHELEKQFEDIEIDDDAFEKIFEFFEQYEWHLDTRHTASGRDINPDVIGYIFEKYINERAAMGAYYTKEDITDYISKNCVLPVLFDETKRNYQAAFGITGEIWKMLRTNSDKYIYDAVKKGVESVLPENIAVGVDTTKPNLLERRKDWNKKAPDAFALPTEIWREVVDRRRRYTEAKAKIESGEINGINDFITCNLNIRQFAQDVVENTTDPKFLEHFYKALGNVTILDPTCGSGAFLFAAMNILEPLYEACIQRMRAFIEDEDRTNLDDRHTFGHKFPFFREVLEDVQSPAHPNLSYFIYKSIILRNLYGVDIMKEAVEVAKLRLFLKLVATVDADYAKPNLGLEPLPDIDFNIRAGNTLIGYVSRRQIDELAALLITADDKKKVLEECDIVARAFRRYKEIQLSQKTDFVEFKNAKDDLNVRLKKLNQSLDKTLFTQSYEGMHYENWKETHQPFHWFAEFYEVVHDKGGFDVIIGNPPYVVYTPTKVNYTVSEDYETLPTKNLYAFVFERSLAVVSSAGAVGLIVQLTSLSSKNLASLQDILRARSGIVALPFPRRPESVFEGVEMPVAVLMSCPNVSSQYLTSSVCRFYTEERDHALQDLEFAGHDSRLDGYRIAKFGSLLAKNIIGKFAKPVNTLGALTRRTATEFVYYQEACRYWARAIHRKPFFRKNGISMDPPHGRTLLFADKQSSAFATCLLNSSLFYWFYSSFGDCEHINDGLVRGLRVSDSWSSTDWVEIADRLGASLITNASRKTIRTKQGYEIEYDEFKVSRSKPILDEIDQVLAKHYDFTEEELDFIVNYDIKYRMGAELDGEG